MLALQETPLVAMLLQWAHRKMRELWGDEPATGLPGKARGRGLLGAYAEWDLWQRLTCHACLFCQRGRIEMVACGGKIAFSPNCSIAGPAEGFASDDSVCALASEASGGKKPA